MKNLLAAAVLIAVVPAGSGELRSFASEPAPAPAAEVAPAPAPGETNDQTLPPSSEGSVEVPEPRILVLDRQALLLKSLVGKSIAAQENELELQQSSSEPSADAREKQIQQAVRQARDRVSAALGPILQGIMSERGANIVIDKGGVVLDLIDIDITNEAIRELDGAMQSTPVTLDKMP